VTPGDFLLRGERGEQQLMLVERSAKECIDGNGTSDRGRGASTLATGKRKSFLDDERDADSGRTSAAEDLGGRDRGSMTIRIAREIGLARLVESDANRVDTRRGDGVPGTRDGASENIQARSEIPDAAWREGADGQIVIAAPHVGQT
jgi:hypothetical protein